MLPVAILAGGLATRLQHLSKDTPKSMIKICNKPFAQWQVESLVKQGVQDAVFCVGYKAEAIEDFMGDGAQFGLNIRYSYDGETLLGTGGAIVKALPLLGDKFMVLNGDSYLPTDFSPIEIAFLKSGKPALMTIYLNENTSETNNVVFQNGELLLYEKNHFLTEMKYIDYGLSFFTSNVFNSFKTVKPLDLSEICCELSKMRLLAPYEVKRRFYEIGSFHGIEEFTRYIEEHKYEL